MAQKDFMERGKIETKDLWYQVLQVLTHIDKKI